MSIGQVAGLALDREVAFPAISMTREAVERMKGERYAGYTTFPVSGRMILDVERLDIVRLHGLRYGGRQNQQMKNGVLLARVGGLELLDHTGKLIHRYELENLASEAKAAAEKVAEAEAQAVEDSRIEIHGVRLGMSASEAESILRSNQKIETVYSFSKGSPLVVYSDPSKIHFEPYSSGLIFFANEEKNAIVLFFNNDNSVIGVTRKMLADGLAKEALASSLRKKYGRSTTSDRHGWVWGEEEKGALCAGQSNFNSTSRMKLIEGKTVNNVTYKVVGIGVRYNASADILADCRTVLQVSERLEGTENPHVDFRLFNHSKVAGELKEMEDAKKSQAEETAKDVEL
jgi:hypothetical protein